jgi:hypothetical protein
MIARASRFQRLFCQLLVAVALSCPAALAGAESSQPGVRIVDDAAHGRLTIVVERVRVGTAEPGSFDGAVRLSRGLMVHSITVEVVAMDGHARHGAAAGPWFEASLGARVGGLPTTMMLDFSPAFPALDLPRPLGLRLDAGDSLWVRARADSATGGELQLRIMLDYSPLEGPVSRLAVLPVQLTPTGSSYEWEAPIAGRLMAFAGLPAGMEGELLLQDVETGSTLWRSVLHSAGSEAFSGRSDVAHVGTPVQAGRRYRLTLQLADGAVPAATHLVHTLLLPVPVVVALGS